MASLAAIWPLHEKPSQITPHALIAGGVLGGGTLKVHFQMVIVPFNSSKLNVAKEQPEKILMQSSNFSNKYFSKLIAENIN